MMIAAVVVFSGAFANDPPEYNCLTRELWSQEKRDWCCANKQLGCPKYNCFTRELWSQEKRDWCCANKQLGCPNPAACICPEIYLPVCGEDNKTYSNKCVAKCNGQSKFTIGECRANEDSPACKCAKIYLPVCGEDNNTYSNKCVAKCNGQSKFTIGECRAKEACKCTKIYFPVCGEDNKTYSNKCVAKCNGQSKFTIGECRAKEDSAACTCIRIFSPVCGKDNKTYSNACVAKCNGQLEFTNGKCRVNAAFTARFERAEAALNDVSVGPNGKVSIVITRTLSGKVESTLLHAEYLRGSRALEGVEGFEFFSGSRREWKPNDNMSQFPITFPSTNTSSNVTITKVGSSWKLSFGRDSNDEAVELKMDVLPRDCKVAAETSTAAEAFMSASTTEETTDSPETLSLDGRRLEAKETTSAPETEIPDETEEEESSSCDPGFSCDPMLKSCQLIKRTLPAGSAGKLESSRGAIQNSSCAILAAMVTYLMI